MGTRSWVSAYLTGAAVSITAMVTIAYYAAKATKSAAGPGHAGTVDRVTDWVVLTLTLFPIGYVYLFRANPPEARHRGPGDRSRNGLSSGLRVAPI